MMRMVENSPAKKHKNAEDKVEKEIDELYKKHKKVMDELAKH